LLRIWWFTDPAAGWLTVGVVAKRSAGMLLFRRTADDPGTEVLLGHMGGPFWARRDTGAWSVPKGEIETGEDSLAAARREFAEEVGLTAPSGDLIELGDVRQSSGKVVTVWAVEADLDPDLAEPGTFDLEWPPGSGRMQSFPELDRVAWLPVAAAADKIVAGQRPFLDRLVVALG
jgi:predicted NUDIX family NTP pyrophosphohydrolase